MKNEKNCFEIIFSVFIFAAPSHDCAASDGITSNRTLNEEQGGQMINITYDYSTLFPTITSEVGVVAK